MNTAGPRVLARVVEHRRASLLLAAVGAAFLVAQLSLFSLDRAPSWDESVYLSQVTPGVPAVSFAPSRARGITFLVAPVTLAGGSVTAVRAWLAVVSSVALVAAFLPWVAVLGLGAPLAAFLMGFSWLGLFYGSEAMPNQWAALAGVAAVGVSAPILLGETSRWRAMGAGALVLVMALIRPPDGAVVAVALLVALVVRGAPRAVLAVGTGLVAGWLPWLVETAVRFGGVSSTVRQGAAVGHVGLGDAAHRVLQHLRLTDGPTLGPDPDGFPVPGLLWWVGILVLSAVGLVAIRRTRAALVAAAASGLAVAGLYLVFVGGVAPRFLLPALAQASVTTAAGVVALIRSAGPARAIGVATLAAIAAWAVWQGSVADRIEREQTASRGEAWTVGLTLGQMAGGGGCTFASTDAFPQLQLASGCTGHQIRGDLSNSTGFLPERAASSARVFLVERTTAVEVPAGWRLKARPLQGWFILLPNGPSHTRPAGIIGGWTG